MIELEKENLALKKSLADLRKDYRILKANYALKAAEQTRTLGIAREFLRRAGNYRRALMKIGTVQPPDFSLVAVQGLVKKVLGK